MKTRIQSLSFLATLAIALGMQGRAAFFAPLTRTVPRRGSPPRMTNLSIYDVLGAFLF